MKNYSIMLKPASSLCDLRCRYCFYADVAARRSVRSFGMMQDSVLRRIMENIARSVAPGDHITLMFQGGEPMLAGLDFFADRNRGQLAVGDLGQLCAADECHASGRGVVPVPEEA